MTVPLKSGQSPAPTYQRLRRNERRILKVLRRLGKASKAELARKTNLTNPAVGSIANALTERNLIKADGKHHKGQRGQPATILSLEPEGAFGIGVRLDRTAIQTVTIDFEGTILSRFSHDILLPHPEKALQMVLKDIDRSLGMLSPERKARLAGIGLARPFNLNCWLDELSLPREQFAGWESYDFAHQLEKHTGIPVFMENDGTAATIAELLYGVGRNLDDFLYLYMGPAIGGGLVLSGEIINGAQGNAADVGLMLTGPSQLPSAPAPRKPHDILLNRASINTLKRHLQFRGISVASNAELETMVDNEIDAVFEWLEDCVAALTVPLWAGRALLDVPTIVLAADLGGRLLTFLQRELILSLDACAPEARQAPKVIIGSFGSDAAAVGAASLPVFYSFSPQREVL